MKPSFFNVMMRHSDNESMILYNSFSGNIELFSKGIAEYVKDIFKNTRTFQNPLLQAQVNNLAIRLYAKGFLIDKNRDEHGELAAQYKLAKFGDNTSKSWHVSIAPTMSCNLDCVYCYAACTSRSTMSKSIQELLVERIKQYVSNNDIKNLSVAWTGGEPLCAWEAVTNISKMLWEFCEKRKCEYSSALVTNGVLLYPRRSAKLAKPPYNVTHVQVTIDGYWHDLTRRYRGKKNSTLQPIFKNLPAAVKNLDVNIRINVPRDMTVSKGKLADFICSLSRFSKKQPGWYVAGIHGVTPESKANVVKEWRIYDLSRFEMEIGTCVAKKRQIKCAPRLPLQRSTGCGFENRDNVCVDPEGYIYKCWHHFNNDEKVIGHIRQPMTHYQYIRTEMFRKWLAWNPHEIEMCKQCLVLPLCQGRCFDVAFEKGAKSTARCDLVRYNLKRRIALSTEAILAERSLQSKAKPCGD